MKTQQEIADILYEELDSIYCYNCRYYTEIDEEEAKKKLWYWGCENCYRKYMGWELSHAAAEEIAKKICEG